MSNVMNEEWSRVAANARGDEVREIKVQKLFFCTNKNGVTGGIAFSQCDSIKAMTRSTGKSWIQLLEIGWTCDPYYALSLEDMNKVGLEIKDTP